MACAEVYFIYTLFTCEGVDRERYCQALCVVGEKGIRE